MEPAAYESQAPDHLTTSLSKGTATLVRRYAASQHDKEAMSCGSSEAHFFMRYL
jgi:hypothetical protein